MDTTQNYSSILYGGVGVALMVIVGLLGQVVMDTFLGAYWATAWIRLCLPMMIAAGLSRAT